MRTEDLEHELLADPLVALPREVAERLALNVAERFGIPIISVATARELDRLYARYKAGLPVTDAELSALLYAVAVAISFAQKELYREPPDRRHRRAASLGAI